MTINQGQNTPKTFEDLLNSVPSVGDGILPKANRLHDSDVLVTKDGGDFKITVYKSGHFVYEEGEHTTVFAVDRCARYVDPVDLSRKLIPYDKIKDLDWYIPLMMFGMSRMEINRNRQHQEHEAFSLRNDGSDYSVFDGSLDDKFQEEEEKREYEAKMSARKENLDSVMGNLTKVQRTCINESYYAKKTRTQIGKELGVSQQAVSKNIDAGLKKARKKFEIFGIE